MAEQEAPGVGPCAKWSESTISEPDRSLQSPGQCLTEEDAATSCSFGGTRKRGPVSRMGPWLGCSHCLFCPLVSFVSPSPTPRPDPSQTCLRQPQSRGRSQTPLGTHPTARGTRKSCPCGLFFSNPVFLAALPRVRPSSAVAQRTETWDLGTADLGKSVPWWRW